MASDMDLYSAHKHQSIGYILSTTCADRHDDKHSTVIYFYLNKSDACLGVLDTPVSWNVLLQGEDLDIHVEIVP